MKSCLATILVIVAFTGHAHAGTITRIVTTTQQQQCRDFTKTTTYVDRVETSQGTACLYPDGAWHVVSNEDGPIMQDNPTYIVQERVVNQPVYYSSQVIYPVPVVYNRPRYYPRPYYNHGYNQGGWGHSGHYDRGDFNRRNSGFSFRGRF